MMLVFLQFIIYNDFAICLIDHTQPVNAMSEACAFDNNFIPADDGDNKNKLIFICGNNANKMNIYIYENDGQWNIRFFSGISPSIFADI